MPSLIGWKPLLVGWRPWLVGWRWLEAIAIVSWMPSPIGWGPARRLETIAIASRLEEAIALRLEAIALVMLEAIATTSQGFVSSSRILRHSAASGLCNHSDKFGVFDHFDLGAGFLSFWKRGRGARRPPERIAAFRASIVPCEDCSGWCKALSSALLSSKVNLQTLKVISVATGFRHVAALLQLERVQHRLGHGTLLVAMPFATSSVLVWVVASQLC